MAQLADPQPRGVGGHQQRLVAQIRGRLQDASHLFAAEDLRQALWLAGAGQVDLVARPLQHFAEQEADGVQRQVATAVGELALVQQMDQIAAHLLVTETVGTEVVVGRYAPHPLDVALFGEFGKTPQEHGLHHRLAQFGHDVLLCCG